MDRQKSGNNVDGKYKTEELWIEKQKEEVKIEKFIKVWKDGKKMRSEED